MRTNNIQIIQMKKRKRDIRQRKHARKNCWFAPVFYRP